MEQGEACSLLDAGLTRLGRVWCWRSKYLALCLTFHGSNMIAKLAFPAIKYCMMRR